MRHLSQRSFRLLQEIRNNASPRYRERHKTVDEIARDARERLAGMDYTDKPVEIGDGLAEQLRR